MLMRDRPFIRALISSTQQIGIPLGETANGSPIPHQTLENICLSSSTAAQNAILATNEAFVA